MARVLIPLPDKDFDTTEVAVPWKLLREEGHEVVFATERGGFRAETDPLLLDGVIFGKLGAEREAKAFYAELQGDPAFAQPSAWNELEASDYDGLLLPGGHARGMRQYLGSPVLQGFVGDYFGLGRPVGAICHGVLLAARANRGDAGQSALHGLRTTCLTKPMERAAYWLTAWKLGRYYRTYPAYVEDEVKSVLADPDDFRRGPLTLIRKGSRDSDRGAFVVEDGAYVSARWPGDAYLFARTFLARL